MNPGRALGGAEQSLLLLLQGLRRHGVDPTVALFGSGPFEDRLSAEGIPTTHVTPAKWVRRAARYHDLASPLRVGALVVAGVPSAFALARVARRTGCDIIHTNGLKAHLLGGVAGRLVGRPVVWHLRDFPPRHLAGAVFRAAARHLPSLVITNSAAVATSLSGADTSVPVRALHNPVDLVRFHPTVPRGRIRRQLGLAVEIPLVGCVAHLTPWKGHGQFLDIAQIVGARLPAAHFVVAGGSIYETHGHAGYLQTLQTAAERLNLTDRVSFLGDRDDIPDVLADLDVLVHCPSAPEPFGRAVAEGMACGRAVVAAAAGGIPEIVEDGRSGLLVPPGDTTAYARAILMLLGDASLREKLGAAASRRAAMMFEPDAHARAVADAYAAVAKRRLR